MSIRLKPVSDQVMVITGATSGIGLATARLAAHEGARLVLVARNGEVLNRIAQELAAQTEVVVVEADVADEAAMNAVAETAKTRFGGFDTWVNNAGVSIYGEAMDVPVADQRRLFDTNFWGMVNGSRAAVPVLRERGGALINIGSVLSDRAIPLQGPYCASKHAVKGWTDALRVELEHEGAPISVTLIKPSAITTPYAEGARNYTDGEPANPPPHYAPEVVAKAILYSAANVTRDFVVGGGGAMIAVLGNLLPSLADAVMSRTMWAAQRTGNPKQDRPDNLYVSQSKGHAHGGPNPDGRMGSVYSFVQMNQWLVAAGLAGALAVAGQLAKPAKKSRTMSKRLRDARRQWRV